jgi:hypothetical protein
MSQETAAPATEAPPATTPPAHSDGLFPTLVKTAPPPAPDTTGSVTSDDWFFMDGVKGTGNRPEYFDSKYATLADQAKAYKDLASKLGMRAPENYDLSKFEDKIDPSNEHVVGLMTFAKQKNLGQDVVEGIFDTYSKIVDSSRVDYAKEIEKLGQGGRQKIETVAQWASNTLSEGAISTINKLGHTAEFINLLDELRQFHSYANQSAQPPGVTAAPSAFKVETIASIEAEMLVPENSQKYLNDAGYRADINARLKRATGE